MASTCTGSLSAAPSTASPTSAGRASATTPARFASPAFGLREGERFAYEYNFSAAWRVDLRVEQITGAPPGRAYPRCTGGRRAGPPEDWAGPWEFLEQTQPHLVFGATVRAAEISGQLLDAGEHHDLADVGVDREELAALMPLLGLERFDRRACNQVLRGLAVGVQTVAEGSRR